MKSFLLFLALSSLSYGYSLRTSQFWHDDLSIENKEIVGHWEEREDWEGTLCHGGYTYAADLRARVHSIVLDLQESGNLVANAELRDIGVALWGSYRSSYSGCVTLQDRFDVRMDNLEAQIQVRLEETGGGPKVHLQILKTRFGKIYFSEWFPGWFEEFATRFVNRVLVEVWSSRLGSWISEKISEEINKGRMSLPNASDILQPGN